MYTVGADVEVFGKARVGHKHIALCGMIGGTKEHPKQLEDSPEGFMVQEDNVSIEYNIPPASRARDFVANIKHMRNKVEEILNGLNLTSSKQCAVSFEKDQLAHPNALVFGCEPDYDAWKKIENKKPKSTDETLRTAGGHVHVGTDNVDMIDGIRAMDLYLGVPSVLLDNSPEAKRRRELYGKAGAMRPKSYGFEYRVLSNFWMFDDNLIQWVYQATEQALNFCNTGKTITNIEAEVIQNCINTGDEALAIELVNKYNLLLPKTGEVVFKEEPKPRDIIEEMKKTHAHLFNTPITPMTWAATPQAFHMIMDDLEIPELTPVPTVTNQPF